MAEETTKVSVKPQDDYSEEEKVDFCLDWINKIDDDNDQINDDREEALQFYRSENLGNEIEGRSQYVTSDLFDTVEWVIPNLMKIFAGGEEVCKVTPRGPEDTEGAEQQHELVNWQLRRRNNWFTVVHDWLKDALLLKIGVIKYQWMEEEKRVVKDYEGLTEQEALSLLSQPDVEVEEFEAIQGEMPEQSDPMMQQAPVTYNVTAVHIIKDERPLIEAVPPDEMGFMKETRDLDKAFVYHRTEWEEWEIVEEFGEEVMDEIRDMRDTLLGDNPDQVKQERFEDLGGVDFMQNVDRDKWYIYECYYRNPDNGIPWITKVCGDKLLSDEENRYGRPPFRILTPIRMPHRIIGRSIHDIIKQLQKLRSVLTRQILDNVYFSNNGRFIGNPDRVNVDDFLNNNMPGGFIRGEPDAVRALDTTPLQPWTFKLLEWVETERDARTGINKNWQGVQSDSINKTARGTMALMNQSQQKIEMMARLFAEMGVGPLVQDVIDMNIKFMTKPVSMRVTNKWVEIQPDNIVGRYDVLVEVGIGTGAKDQIIAQMQQLLGIYSQLMKAGVPIATPQNVYHAMKELIKAMGYRNTNDFVSDPGVVQQIQQLIQVMLQFMQANGIQNPQVMQMIMGVAQAFGINLQGNPQLQSPGEGSATQPNLPQEPAQAMNPMMTPGPEGGA